MQGIFELPPVCAYEDGLVSRPLDDLGDPVGDVEVRSIPRGAPCRHTPGTFVGCGSLPSSRICCFPKNGLVLGWIKRERRQRKKPRLITAVLVGEARPDVAAA